MTAGPVRKVTFWEGGEGETVPLLGPQSRTEERDSRGRRRDQDQHGKGGDSQAATSDAIEELERLPLLLLRTIVFFTLAICLSAFLGVVSRGSCSFVAAARSGIRVLLYNSESVVTSTVVR